MQHPAPLHRALKHRLPVRSEAAPGLLSDGQLEVLSLLSDGSTQQQVADDLGISDSAVKARLAAARAALNAKTTCHAVALSWRYRLLPRN